MIVRLAIGALIVAVVALAAFEFNRWRDAAYRDALSRAQKGRRIAGAVLLLTVLGMVYGGTYLPSHAGAYVASLELLYWLLCLLVAVFLPIVAYLEAKTSLLKFARERREAKAEAAEGMEDLIRRAMLNSSATSNGADKKIPPAP